MPQSGVRHDRPILLVMESYSGTLAAARCLGEHGISVTVAGQQLLAPTRWSRHTARWVRCPPVAQTREFLAWLLDFGRREPGHVLYPASDDLAWLLAANAAELEQHFLTYQPPLETMVRILDKKALQQACRSAGIETVPTWFPESEADVSDLAGRTPLPLLIKARTQVLRARQTKGTVVNVHDELLPSYRRFLKVDHYLPGIEAAFGDVTRPMLQAFCAQASQAVCSVTGFIDRSGELFVARASVKVLQRTHPVGLGVCFEAVPLDRALADAVARLCRSTGYFGIFEVEFLHEGGRWMAIDFNPRFYGQMGFEAQRGLPLALFAWLGASGNESELRERVAMAARASDGPASIYCHRFVFELLVLVLWLTGRMPTSEWNRWKAWYARHRAGAVDASADARDWLPGLVHSTSEFLAGMRALPKVFSRD